MGLAYGTAPVLIKPEHISQVNLVQCTLEESSVDLKGGAVLEFLHQAVGCGSSGFTILLENVIPWTKLTYRWRHEGGGAACWNINHGNSTNYLPSAHNIKTYDAAQGDRFFLNENAFELSQYAIKTFACDNSSNNFLHSSYHTGGYKTFMTTRRRNAISSGLAGPAFGKACIWGPGKTIISDIRVML